MLTKSGPLFSVVMILELLIEHEQPMLNTWPTINASECQSDHKMKQFYQFAIVSNTKLTLQTKHSTQTRLPRN